MPVSPLHVLKLVEGVDARKEKGFRVSPQTAPLVIEALRLFARMHVGEPAKYKVEKWDWKDLHVEEIVASASLIMIGRAAFHATVEQYPRTRLTLRHGADWPKG
jgi:hypothetical protein